jgi:hypothetical protein
MPHLLQMSGEAVEPDFTLGERWRSDGWSDHPVGAQEREKPWENSSGIRKPAGRMGPQWPATDLPQILSDMLVSHLRERELLQPQPPPKGINTAQVTTNRVVSKALLVQEGRKTREVWPGGAFRKPRKDRRTRKKRGEHILLLSA